MAKNLLYFMLGNVEMAKISTQQLIEITDDSDFRDMLFDDLSEYEKFYNRIIQLKTKSDYLRSVSPLAALCTKAAINAKTARDKSPRKMSEMLVKGYVRGIQDIEENIVKAVKCSERREVIALAKDYRRHLIANMERYRKI